MEIIKNTIDIKKTNLEICQITHPLVFLFRLIPHIEDIDDISLSIILRLYLKHHSDVAFSFNLKKLLVDELKNKFLSWAVLSDFYKIMNKKFSLVFILKKWFDVYDNNFFWKLSIGEQIDHLSNTKLHFLGIYDCAKGGIPLHYKVGTLLKDKRINRDFIVNDLIERLVIILNIFGLKLFQTMEIPLITVKEFLELTDENIIKYIVVIYDKFIELLNQTIKLFDSYNLICIQLNNLLNPMLVNINSGYIDSETEFDDIKLYSS
jgi:hypothetical protein